MAVDEHPQRVLGRGNRSQSQEGVSAETLARDHNHQAEGVLDNLDPSLLDVRLSSARPVEVLVVLARNNPLGRILLAGHIRHVHAGQILEEGDLVANPYCRQNTDCGVEHRGVRGASAAQVLEQKEERFRYDPVGHCKPLHHRAYWHMDQWAVQHH